MNLVITEDQDNKGFYWLRIDDLTVGSRRKENLVRVMQEVLGSIQNVDEEVNDHDD